MPVMRCHQCNIDWVVAEHQQHCARCGQVGQRISVADAMRRLREPRDKPPREGVKESEPTAR